MRRAVTYLKSAAVLSRKGRALTTTSALAILASACPEMAYAQTPAPQNAQAPAVEEIVVTGTRVVRDGYEAPTPLTVVGVQELQASAVPEIADYLSTLPTFAGGRPNVLNVGTNTGEAGLATLSLRDLGPARTLVLFDGHRTVGGSVTGAIDSNTLPQQLINRVDVVTGGASAAYGSDALAGVVNFILDKKFTGIKGEVSGGVTGFGDARNWKINISGGSAFAGDKGHFLFSGEATHADPADGALRPWDNSNIGIMTNPAYGTGPGQSTSVPQNLVRDPVNRSNLAPGGLITNGPLKGIAFGPGGTPYQFDYGLLNDGASMYGSSQAKSLSYHLNQELGINITHQNVFLRASYDITDDINVYAEVTYANATTVTHAIGPLFAGNLTLKADNAFLPASIAAQAAALKVTQFAFGSANADMGFSPVLRNRRQKLEESVGATGRLDAFGSTWNWDAYLGSGVSRQASHNTRTVFLAAYNNALDAVRGPNGSIVCRINVDANPANDDPKCVPYNAFGIGVNSQAALDYVLRDDQRNELYVMNDAAVSVSGEPFSSWAGPISLALGIEHRNQSVRGSSTQPTGYLNGNYQPALGRFNVTEGFAETVIPLAKDTVWAKTLDFNGAIRATDYSTSGYVTTWKLGLTWTPIEDLRFRMTRSRDIRAPNLSDLFAGQSSSFQNNRQDPFNNNATVTVNVQGGGNPLLKPEKADTIGLGVVMAPQFFPGFTASVDYWKIDVKDIIGAQTGPLNLCYQGRTQFCSLFQRVVQSGVSLIIEQNVPVNLAQTIVSGIDFDATYRLNLADISDNLAGNTTFHFIATNNLRNWRNPVLTPAVDYVGENQGSSGDGGLVRWNWSLSGSYNLDPIDVSITARGITGGNLGATFIQCTSACPVSTLNNPTIDVNYVKGAMYFDGALSYKVSEGITAYLNVKNLAGTDPELVPHTGINAPTYAQTNLGLYDYLGRVFRAGVRFKM
ncbi:MAG: TonB-dependent receptor [Rhodospirillaceae bacterium]|nr:TonB-dependent receptor [Rhodospirillaceae bacterium]